MESVGEILGVTAFSLLLAFLCESMVEYFLAIWIDLAAQKWPGIKAADPLKYVAAAVGVAMAFAYGLDIIAAAFPEQAPFASWVGILLTGLAVGRGSNFVHDVWAKYLKPEEGLHKDNFDPSLLPPSDD